MFEPPQRREFRFEIPNVPYMHDFKFQTNRQQNFRFVWCSCLVCGWVGARPLPEVRLRCAILDGILCGTVNRCFIRKRGRVQ